MNQITILHIENHIENHSKNNENISNSGTENENVISVYEQKVYAIST